ncbi:MAG: transposase [Bacilli bacterium]|nr:transposase [Bacilli bacterium]
MKKQRVEKHIIKENDEYYEMLDGFCYKSKNLYNFANYHVRKQFIDTGEWLRYYDLDKLMKQPKMDFDYRSLPAIKSSQQCLRLLDKNWKSFFKSIKNWNKNKSKYNGRPKLPKYLPKNGRNLIILTNQSCKIKNGILKFPKTFNNFTLKTQVNSSDLQQVRILPRSKHIVIELVYNKQIKDLKKDNQKYVSIDIGLDNLLTLTTNTLNKPMIINGKILKSENKYYNKQISYYREITKRMNGLDYTRRMNFLTNKRNNIINDLIHKASRKVIEYALSCDANTIVIGNNKNWKQNSKMSAKVNQSFVGIPHSKLIQQIQYKAEDYGINVILTEESYTSGTSFLDNELPIKENYNKNRRIYRGLFKSNSGRLINADVNASYQILKKVFPNIYNNVNHGIEDYVFNPIRVNL